MQVTDNRQFNLNRPPYRFMNAKRWIVERACEKTETDKSRIREVWTYDFQRFFVVDWDD